MTFQSFLAAQFPGAEVTDLSGSNNTVYRVRAASGEDVVVKHVTDSEIPLTYMVEANARLADFLPVQRILRTFEVARGDPFDAVFAEYVEGQDLAALLAADNGGLPVATLVDFLCEFVAACRRLPTMHDGFGMFKRGAPTFGTHPDFMAYYGRRYWARVRPFYSGTPVADAVEEWLVRGLPAALRAPAPPTVVAVDANLKNLVVTPDLRIVVLNVPIAALSTSAHAVGAVSVHLRHRDSHDRFLRAVARGPATFAADLIPHFELWTLLGIMSFYAAREPRRHEQWRNWGSPVPLGEDFRGLVEDLAGKMGLAGKSEKP